MANATAVYLDPDRGLTANYPNPLDAGVPWHYGDPLGEQRRFEEGAAVVDLSHRDIVRVAGADRLDWLNDLVSQQVNGLRAGESTTGLILDPHGHVEFEFHLLAAAEECWLTTEPGHGQALTTYLDRMRFLRDVSVSDGSDDLSIVGWLERPSGVDSFSRAELNGSGWVWEAAAEFDRIAVSDAGRDAGGGAERYHRNRSRTWPAREWIVATDQAKSILEAHPIAGLGAWESARVAAGVPRVGFDTDHKTLPHEAGWIGPAVHLAKGCYRGQETVARVHNLGRPPRRLVLLYLDGSRDDLPSAGANIEFGGRPVGRIGSSTWHFESGPLALGLVKSRIDPAAELVVREGDVEWAATQEIVVTID